MRADHVIADRYRLDEELGEGGMGVVWCATDLELGRAVALKRSRDGDTGQIRREARIGAGLLHQNVVTVFDTVVDGEERWLVTEYLPARSLEQVIEADGPLPEDLVARIGAQLADALAAMHARGIVHRDVKPGNVLVTGDGTAKLTDLGIARWAEVTRTGGAQLTGTVGYVAPEVADGHDAGPAADVFSLGATLYAAVEGHSPWGTGEDGPFVQMRRAAAGRVDPFHRADRLRPVLTALLRVDPAGRPTAAEATLALAGGQEVPPRRPGPPGRRRRRLAAAAAGVGAIALVTTFALTAGPPERDGDLPGTLGADPAAADPCAALSTDALAGFGEAFIDPELGNFGTCVVTTTLPDEAGQVQTHLDLTGPLRYPPRPPTPGQVGGIERPDVRDGACTRALPLADLNRVVITSRPLDDAENTPVCAISETVVGTVAQMLANGPLPHRAQPLPSWSLAHVDACALLSGSDVATALRSVEAGDASLGGWQCDWDHDRRTVRVHFSREWPIEDDADVVGTRIRVGDRNAVIAATGKTCQVQVVHRFYTPPSVLHGTEEDREEIVVVDFKDPGGTDQAALCETARTPAAAAVARLP
ncbi:protein kinase domain-containing protein [Actinokineospora spheciospongiae]|uniref:protein kinase domain-containing protein n=1 Tax=Actinokineospora spheciospongiae TaxID=909613 RepID=UPI000D7141B6|nr:serine/threonine-protein kinase [Actinokineospora spheciospongiae]PWW63338.1 serine/threonine protein kinase [Actinokineospora spheciospongiae]